MKIDKGVPKRITAILWVFVSGLFLWFLSFGVKQEFTFDSFFIVTALAFGWSAAYHFLTNILEAPYTEKNKKEWFKMIWVMSKVLFFFLLAGVAVVIDKYIWPKNGLLAIFTIFVCYIIASVIAGKAEKQFKKIINENS